MPLSRAAAAGVKDAMKLVDVTERVANERREVIVGQQQKGKEGLL